MKYTNLVYIDGMRTPMAEYSGTPKFGKFENISAVELGAIAARAVFAKTKLDPAKIDNVVFGNVIQSGAGAIYGARHVALKAEVPIETPALTVNRLCGSGLQAIVSSAESILLGYSKVALAGGFENMSASPYIVPGLRSGLKFGRPMPQLVDSLWEGLTDSHCKMPMAMTAQNLASKYEISRTAQDEFALRSHQLAAKATAEKLLADEIVPVVYDERKNLSLDFDDHVKPETTLDALSKIPSPFGKDGTVTGGNASGIVDGGAAAIIADEAWAKSLGLTPKAKIVSWGIVGVDPAYMGIGPAPAIRQALDRAGMKLADVDLFEINEAFAAQYLAVEKELGLDREKVNVNGGAIGLGHPLGCSGTRITITLVNELRKRGKEFGVASACIGGGQGIALLVQAI
ncbi:MAG: acetyl-CoA C-acetyltransferase [Planctomycetes bacterium]|nr:acetyl-CoA C-acetyltransferase [Planctomycetota bacterium]